MTSQLTFADLLTARTRARRTDPHTSHEAARRAGGLASEHQRTILGVMEQGGDWTADEIAAQCDLNRHQIGRRLGELERDEFVRRSGQTRPTPSGRMAQCYEVAEGRRA